MKQPKGCAFLYYLCVTGQLENLQESDIRDQIKWIKVMGFHVRGYAPRHFGNMFGNRFVVFCPRVRQAVCTVVNWFVVAIVYCMSDLIWNWLYSDYKPPGGTKTTNVNTFCASRASLLSCQDVLDRLNHKAYGVSDWLWTPHPMLGQQMLICISKMVTRSPYASFCSELKLFDVRVGYTLLYKCSDRLYEV